MGWGDGSTYDHLTCDRCGCERAYLGMGATHRFPVSKTRLVSEAREHAAWRIGQRILCAGCSSVTSRSELDELPKRNPHELYPANRQRYRKERFGYMTLCHKIPDKAQEDSNGDC